MTEEDTLGFIGAGNMATALIRGILQSNLYTADRLMASDKDEKSLQRVSIQFKIRCTSSNNEVVRQNKIVIFAVKPQDMKNVLQGVKGDIRKDQLFISIAAGISLGRIREAIGRDIPMIRVMPNTPALIQRGISAMAGGALATPEHMRTAGKILNAVGETVEVEERLMDAVTALSGSGPGYVFRLMECMIEAGVAVGLERGVALRLVIQTFLGAACLAKDSDRSLAELRQMVTSPGGTTAAGLSVLNDRGVEEILRQAVEAACRRSMELGKAG